MNRSQIRNYLLIAVLLIGIGFVAQNQFLSITSGTTQIEEVWSVSVNQDKIFENEQVTLTINSDASFNGYIIESDTGQQIELYGGGEPIFIQETPWNMPSTYQVSLQGEDLEPGTHTYYVKSAYCGEYLSTIGKYRCDDIEFYDTFDLTVDVREDADNDGVFDRNDECPENPGAKPNGCPNLRQQVNRLVGDLVGGVTGFFGSLI